MKVAFLTTDNLEEFFVYDELLIPVFAERGINVETVSWRQPQDWNRFDVVVVRSTWDYQQYPEAFLTCLREIDASSARLENPLPLMEWNIHKTYLKDLAQQGVPIVPTVWSSGFEQDKVAEQFERFCVDELIVKPVLSANADDTFRLSKQSLVEQSRSLTECFENRDLMIQPFLKSVVEEGEYSLFYFAGTFSHAILKRPKKGDFRVQEEHGGQLAVYKPTKEVEAVSLKALSAMPTDYLYARVDVIRTEQGWAVMELELIEPSLYFNLDETSISTFVDAFIRYI